MDEAWRELKVGDRVRIVRIPTGAFSPGYFIHEDTIRLYRLLIQEQVVLTIDSIDEYGHLWINYEETDEQGETIYHGLALNEDSWERVQDLPV